MNWAPRWRKLAGDVRQHRGQLAVMISAIAVGVFALGAISAAYVILAREIDRGFLATNPPSGVLEVDRLDRATLDAVGQQDGVAVAEAAGTVWARVQVRPREWVPLLLFVGEDWSSRQIGTVTLEVGSWPIDTQGVVLERSAVAVAGTAVGRELLVQTTHGTQRRLTVTGIAHDASVPPAAQHQVVYGYVTTGTVKALGEDSALHELQVTVKHSDDATRVEGVIVGLAKYLQRTGHVVGEIRIPPRHHPHWMLMSHLVAMLLVFSITMLALSGVLAATLTAALLAPQVRQIGIMKAVGARSSQIVWLYGTLTALIGGSAVIVGLPAGVFAGRCLAALVVRNQNMDLLDSSLPASWLALQIFVGVALPLGACLVPIMNAARRTACESLRDHGVQGSVFAIRPIVVPLSFPSRWHTPLLKLVIRNCLRRRRRLWLTLSLLGAAGALFIATVNVREAWSRNLIHARNERHFSAEIRLAKPEVAAAAKQRVMAVSGVQTVETFGQAAAALERGDDLRITRTFPDGGHGSLRLHAVPVDTAFLRPMLIAGRWLSAADREGAILNDQALAALPGIKVGDPLRINVAGRKLNLRVAGVIREHLAGAALYVSTDEYADALNLQGVTEGLRIGLSSEDESTAIDVMAAIEASLEAGGFRVVDTTTQAEVGRVLAGHLFILIYILLAMSTLMAMVGVLGLASAMTTQVLERTREFGVMRALGASDRSIFGMVLGEGVLTGLISIAVAALLSVPLTAGIATAVGNAAIGPALDVVLSAWAVPLWTVIVLVTAVFAVSYPARRASKLTVRAALVYE